MEPVHVFKKELFASIYAMTVGLNTFSFLTIVFIIQIRRLTYSRPDDLQKNSSMKQAIQMSRLKLNRGIPHMY